MSVPSLVVTCFILPKMVHLFIAPLFMTESEWKLYERLEFNE